MSTTSTKTSDIQKKWVLIDASGLVVGRLLHAFGVSHVRENLRFRTAGMVLTFGVLVSAAVSLLVRWVNY